MIKTILHQSIFNERESEAFCELYRKLFVDSIPKEYDKVYFKPVSITEDRCYNDTLLGEYGIFMVESVKPITINITDIL